MSVLVDTDILVRRTQPDHEHHAMAVESVARLLAAGETVCFAPQNIAEFWNVVTRPETSNGLGFPASVALGEVEKVERILTLPPESPAIYAEWKRLIVKHSVLSVKVHDARLAAAMNVHVVGQILTFDIADFARYGIGVVHPSSVIA